ncbi:MAG TPA: hypothetical protein VFM88_14270 [Vicinamibacteria bacterium]|nr:hypothetical protein [Vicinamibacteria bacterium]
MHRKGRAALSLLAAVCCRAALAQTRPLLTEEATTAPAGSIVVESGFDWISNQPNYLTGAERIRWDGPVLNLVYAPAANVELDVEWVAAVGVVKDPGFGTRSEAGDVTLRSKVRFADDTAGHPALAARFAVTLPQTGFGDGLAPNTLRFRAEVLLSKRLGRATLHANAGLALEDAPLEPHEQADFFSGGAALGLRAFKALTLLAEVNGFLGNALVGVGDRGEARLGLAVGGGRVQGDAAVRHGLVPETGDWGFTAGLRLRLR